MRDDKSDVLRCPCRQRPGTGAGTAAGTAGAGRTGCGSSGTAARRTPRMDFETTMTTRMTWQAGTRSSNGRLTSCRQLHRPLLA